jgi:hypothetical protein
VFERVEGSHYPSEKIGSSTGPINNRYPSYAGEIGDAIVNLYSCKVEREMEEGIRGGRRGRRTGLFLQLEMEVDE